MGGYTSVRVRSLTPETISLGRDIFKRLGAVNDVERMHAEFGELLTV
jgi:hypothetical protein